jgi:hypothetical protein
LRHFSDDVSFALVEMAKLMSVLAFVIFWRANPPIITPVTLRVSLEALEHNRPFSVSFMLFFQDNLPEGKVILRSFLLISAFGIFC